MKTKINLIIAVVVLSLLMLSCGQNENRRDDSNSATVERSAPKKYSVELREDMFSVKLNVIAFEYTKEGDRIYENDFSLDRGECKTFEAQKDAYKVKLYVKHWPASSEGWVPLVYILSEGDTKMISVDDHTRLDRYEP